jgi:hypothetical protein
MWKPLDDDLSSPWVLRRSSPVLPVRSTHESSFRSPPLPTVSPADICEELGPRSLDPDRSFWSAFAELIRGLTSLTDFCNCVSTCAQPNPSSSILAGTEASTSFLFFSASRPLPCGSGETWRAALRPSAATPVPVLPACAGLPDRDAASAAPPPRLAPRSIVRIDVHGSKDRAKDASPFFDVGYDFSCLRGCIRLVAYADDVPLLGALRTSAVIGAFPPREDTRESERTDLGPHSDDAPRRAPPSKRPGCLHPSRHAKESVAERLLPPAFAPAPSLTPPTPLPRVGKVLLMGIARSRCGHPRIRDGSRVQTPL